MRRQVAQPGEHAAQFLVVDLIVHCVENQGNRLRINGQFLVVITNVKALFIQSQLDMSSDQFCPILIAQNGQQQLILQLSF